MATAKKQQLIVITMIKLILPIYFVLCMQIFANSPYNENNATDIIANKVVSLKKTLHKATSDTSFIYSKELDSVAFNEKGQRVSVSEFMTDSTVKHTLYYQYDEFDSLISEVRINTQGLPDFLRVNSFVYERDTLVEKKISNEDHFVIYRYVYKYLNGRISKIIHYDADGSSEKYDSLSYDSKGRVLNFDTKTHFGKLISRISYLYDESGNLSFKRSESFDDSTKIELKFAYSLNKLIITETVSGKDEQIKEIIRAGNGLIDEIVIKDKDNHPIEKIKYIYYYNSDE